MAVSVRDLTDLAPSAAGRRAARLAAHVRLRPARPVLARASGHAARCSSCRSSRSSRAYGFAGVGRPRGGSGSSAAASSGRFAEYWLHRTVFHFEPDHPLGRRLHFIIHGVHHDHPNDRMRLVMPPSASLPAGRRLPAPLPRRRSAPRTGCAFSAGFLFGYLVYDMTHYHLHHHKPKTRLGKRLREQHMRHHFQDHDTGFGVSSPVWDHVFGTVPRRRSTAQRPHQVAPEVPGQEPRSPRPGCGRRSRRLASRGRGPTASSRVRDDLERLVHPGHAEEAQHRRVRAGDERQPSRRSTIRSAPSSRRIPLESMKVSSMQSSTTQPRSLSTAPMSVGSSRAQGRDLELAGQLEHPYARFRDLGDLERRHGDETNGRRRSRPAPHPWTAERCLTTVESVVRAERMRRETCIWETPSRPRSRSASAPPRSAGAMTSRWSRRQVRERRSDRLAVLDPLVAKVVVSEPVSERAGLVLVLAARGRSSESGLSAPRRAERLADSPRRPRGALRSR